MTSPPIDVVVSAGAPSMSPSRSVFEVTSGRGDRLLHVISAMTAVKVNEGRSFPAHRRPELGGIANQIGLPGHERHRVQLRLQVSLKEAVGHRTRAAERRKRFAEQLMLIEHRLIAGRSRAWPTR